MGCAAGIEHTSFSGGGAAYERPAGFDTDYGKAQSVCRESAPAVFERSYEKAHVSLNCSSWVASIKMKA